MTGLSLLLFAITFMYWNFRPDVNFLLTKQDLVSHPIWRTAFYIHIFGGMLAIALGPFQFVKAFRKRNLNFHRLTGKIYIGAILFIAAPTGLYMAFYANGGFYSTLGFLLMSVLWFYTTYMALHTIKKKQIQNHSNWMVRSYAMTFAAVTLRLWVPFLSLLAEMEHLKVIVVTAWISWLFNLIAAELIIKMNLKTLKP
ncbi:MAG: DUF2306 domain-containing protein [Bacteroidetes bacterium]|nr:DUF2306 domain-containing protein [Bacteroidota bacterium]